jgi:hypothetical protein
VNRNRKRRHVSPFTESDITTAARLRGCNCKPDMARRHVDGIPRVILFHEHDCPAIDGTQLLLRRDRHQSAADFAAAVADIVRAIEEP